ncbi:MAG: hypothetical protein GWN71_22465, partial [Gammaproteobacteria bacterium]|nr:hypothetical protein [Gemmatimonadota bacterium]NIU76224.1 hypothetical protein [Gammaproteobacteria bacterium]
MRLHRTAIVAATIALATCAPPDDQETGSVDREDLEQAREEMPATALEQLDAGNASYR